MPLPYDLAAMFGEVRGFVQGVSGVDYGTFDRPLNESMIMDPRLRARVPMSSEGIDKKTRHHLGKAGLYYVKLATAETHPELMRAWEIMCQRAGLEKAPQLIIAESKMVNALTLNRHEVAVTTGLLEALDLRETVAVLGHELGHARNDHGAVRIAAHIGFGGIGLLVGSVFGYFADVIGFLTGGVTANQVTVKPTELQADLEGAAISGDPEGLIRALHKLNKHNHKNPITSFVGYMNSGYPTMKERIDNLQLIASHMPPAAIPPDLVVTQPGKPAAKVNAVSQNDRVAQADAALTANV